MHLSPLTLSIGTLLGSITLTIAEKTHDLEYLKCASAVVKDASFPGCTSTYKLDCFCEAQAQARKERIGTTAPAAPMYLSAEAEGVCAGNGVPRDEIAKYLCDDDAVPASPRRGSKPMVRLEPKEQPVPRDTDTGTNPDTESFFPFGEETEEQDKDSNEESKSTPYTEQKRAIQPDMTRLLIPENDITGADGSADKSPPHDEEEDDHDEDNTEEQKTANEVYQVVTMTVTEAQCYAKTTPTHEAEPGSEGEDDVESEEKSSGSDVHGKNVVVQTSAPASAPSSSVRVAGSTAVESSAASVPTGVDASRGHGPDHGGDDDKNVNKETFKGGAVGWCVSRDVVVVGVLGVLAGMVWL